MNVRITAPRTAAETKLAEQFSALKGGDADRAAAFSAFAASGLPTRRNEAWHYTDLRAAMMGAAPIAPAPDDARIATARAALSARKRLGDVRLVLVDGYFVSRLSDEAPAGAMASVLAKSVPLDPLDPVVTLNEAFARPGLTLLVDAGANVSQLIEIVHVASGGAPAAVFSRVHINLFPGASARFVEVFIGAGPQCQRNALTNLRLNNGSRCEHTSLIDDNAALHLESQIATLGSDAEFNAFALVKGGALVRRQIFATLKGEHASIKLGGLSLLDGARHADTTLVVEHAAPHGESREFFKHIIADDAVGVYQGKVIVKPGAQKTDGGMKSQAILLSPRAVMNN